MQSCSQEAGGMLLLSGDDKAPSEKILALMGTSMRVVIRIVLEPEVIKSPIASLASIGEQQK
jgi:hypothetical protein